ncbi:MAG: hypothetical protein KJZ77_19090 [Anaerolineales bacterium]|nr:hypothetical protein [Anaerolineales bacterium]
MKNSISKGKLGKALPLFTILLCLANIQLAKAIDMDDEDWELVQLEEDQKKESAPKALSKSDLIKGLQNITSAIFGQNQPYIIYVDSKDFFKKSELNVKLFETIGQAIKFIENNMSDSLVLKKQMIDLQVLYHQILREPILLVEIVHKLLSRVPKNLTNPFERNLDYTRGAGKELDTRLEKLRAFIAELRASKKNIDAETFYLPSKKNAREVMNALIDQLIIICQRMDFVIRHIMCLADPRAEDTLCPGFRSIRFERKN